MRNKIWTMMALVLVGACTTTRTIELDAQHPSVEVKTTGIYFAGERVAATDVPEILEDADVPKNRTIHILVDGNLTTLKEARQLMGVLALSGYTRPVLVTKRHAESGVKNVRR